MPDEDIVDYWHPEADDCDYEDELDEDFSDLDPCLDCGPHCKHWMGDSLCELEFERQVAVAKEFEKRFVSLIMCPVCNMPVQQISLPTSELWVWPGGDWIFAGEAMLGLEWFGTIYSEKKVLHTWREEDVIFHHVWTMKRSHNFILKLRKEIEKI